MRKTQERLSKLDSLGGRNLTLFCTWKI